MTLVSVITVFGIVLGIFLCVLLLSLNNRNKTANRFLGLIMIVSSLIICGFGVTKFGLYLNMPHLIGISSIMICLISPLFYFYARSVIQNDFVFNPKMYLHFTPFVLLVIYMLPFYVQDPETKLKIFYSDSFSAQHRIIIFMQAIHALIYMFFTRKLIKQHVQMIKNSMSSSERINLVWIKIGINFFTFIICTVVISLVLLFSGIKIHSIYSELIPVAISIAVLSLGFIGLRQPIVFPPAQEISQVKKYEKSTLTNELANKYLEELQLLMKKEKPYLKSDLTLQKLADTLSIPQYHLSQIINEKMSKNFFDFVNSYRVEEAKQLLLGPKSKQLTILAIAQEAGFNSKSSFNTAFKNYTGKTPTQFRHETFQNN